MTFDDVRIRSTVSDYWNDYYDIMEFCKRGNDVITVSYRNGNHPIRDIKFQPNSPAAQRIRDAIKDDTLFRMEQCRNEDVEYRLRQAELIIKSLREAVEATKQHETVCSGVHDPS